MKKVKNTKGNISNGYKKALETDTDDDYANEKYHDVRAINEKNSTKKPFQKHPENGRKSSRTPDDDEYEIQKYGDVEQTEKHLLKKKPVKKHPENRHERKPSPQPEDEASADEKKKTKKPDHHRRTYTPEEVN